MGFTGPGRGANPRGQGLGSRVFASLNPSAAPLHPCRNNVQFDFRFYEESVPAFGFAEQSCTLHGRDCGTELRAVVS